MKLLSSYCWVLAGDSLFYCYFLYLLGSPLLS